MREPQKSRLRTWAKRIAVDVAVGYLLGCAVGMLMMNTLMFRPHAPSYSWESPHVVNIGGASAPIAALWIPNAATNRVILYSHGNGEDIGDFAGFYGLFAEAGLSLLVYDYPGYGLSAGKPTEQGAYDTAEAAYRFLAERCAVAPSDIIALGRSIGSGPACYLAEKYPVGGLVIESGFTSAPRVVTRIRILPFDPFPNIRRIPNIPCPKLFIHGTVDGTVPFAHAKAMLAAAREPKAHLWVEGAGHDDILDALGEAAYFEALNALADTGQD
ncbi:MAG: alpha/beta hydrolase [Kiritimatiellaeota bacterium]|nr:alpha/beta hydrolase [Kiritimatiellota bacterium]